MALFRNSIRLLTTGLGFLIIGIVLTVMTLGDIIDNAKTPADYNQLQMEDFKEGMMVEGDLLDNYGWYENVTRENDSGAKNVVGYYYLIDAGDEGLMGLYTPMKDLIKAKIRAEIKELDKQEEEGNDYYYGYSDTKPRTVHFKGKVCKMDSEDVKFFREYLSDQGLTSADIDEMGVELYIKVTDVSNNTPVLIIGIVISVLGLLFCFLFVRNKMMGR